MENMKGVFCCDKGNRITRKNGINKLNRFILKNSNCNSSVDYFADKAVIYVPENEYFKCLYVGKKFAKMYNIDVSWLNVRGEPRSLDYISIMHGLLPTDITCPISKFDINQFVSKDIEVYIYYLKKFLGNKEVITIYDKVDNGIEILVKTSIDDYELIRQQCEGFNYTYKNVPFSKIFYLENDGTLNRDDIKVIELKENGQESQKKKQKKNYPE